MVALDPSNPLPHLRLAEACCRVQSLDEAIDLFWRAAELLLGLGRREDALKVVIWADDARVVGYDQLGKWYAGTDARDVLAMPGCVISVWPLAAEVRCG